MRHWHRRLGIFVAVPMAFVAVTGALLQFQMLADAKSGPPSPGAPAAGVDDAQAQALLASALAGAHRQSSGALMGIELRFAGAPTAEVVVAEPALRRLRLDARTGAPLDEASRPGRRDWHGVLLDLHRGAVAGVAGQWISLVCGVVLAVLSVTGLVVYVQMYRRRRANRRSALVW